mmetsp:Transcript_7894/g.7491  ORF Transcript_7894/g.7491 Transcript_7894/m.7491 type:complete len:88 (+) Transcript_7894:711-974(+)
MFQMSSPNVFWMDVWRIYTYPRQTNENVMPFMKEECSSSHFYMNHLKVLDDDINLCMDIICIMEQYMTSLSRDQSNVHILQLYPILK